MHPLHDDIARLLGERVRARSIVVWYDPRREFEPFVKELRGGQAECASPVHVVLPGGPALLVQFAESMFELRALIEPWVGNETPPQLVIYLPGCIRDDTGSVLMEVEKSGGRWEPRLKSVALNVLRRKYTDGDIDRLLEPDAVTYEDIARAAADSDGEGPSLLKGVFREAPGGDGIIAAWLMDESRDPEIEQKQATGELARLIRSRLSLDVPEETPLLKARAMTLRYVLGGEFRSDLAGPAPAGLDSVPSPKTKAEESAVRDMAHRLRATYSGTYAAVASRVETDLSLAGAGIPAEALGSIDTFAFEERVVFSHCADLIAGRSFAEALVYVAARDRRPAWRRRSPCGAAPDQAASSRPARCSAPPTRQHRRRPTAPAPTHPRRSRRARPCVGRHPTAPVGRGPGPARSSGRAQRRSRGPRRTSGRR
jgi:hypothetical protein